MENGQINGLATNHNLAPLPKEKRIWALDVKEMKPSFKIDLKDVSWWMSIKNACKLGTFVIAELSIERCISLVVGRSPSHATCKHD
jgi:hypothetical protein